MSIVIEANGLVPAWVKAVRHLQESGGETRNIVLDVSAPGILTEADQGVIKKVDAALRLHADTSINTVAATIFPQAMYARYGRPKLYEEFQRRMKKAKNKGTWGTYALRMMERKGKGPKPVNPLEQIIDKLKRASNGGHPYKSNYELGVYEPEDDLAPDSLPSCELPIYDPASDGPKIGNIPCLSHVTFKMTGKSRVDLTAIYRSHYYCDRALGNLVGLSQLLGFVAKESGLERGNLTCISTHAVLDLGAWGGAVAGNALIDQLKN